jgi:hypothetical protein
LDETPAAQRGRSIVRLTCWSVPRATSCPAAHELKPLAPSLLAMDGDQTGRQSRKTHAEKKQSR